MLPTCNPDSRTTQRDRILQVLKDARGSWVPLPEILDLGIAQYKASIFELRRLDFRIENRAERRDGQNHTFFRLVPTANAGHSVPPTKTSPQVRNRGETTPVRRSELPPSNSQRLLASGVSVSEAPAIQRVAPPSHSASRSDKSSGLPVQKESSLFGDLSPERYPD